MFKFYFSTLFRALSQNTQRTENLKIGILVPFFSSLNRLHDSWIFVYLDIDKFFMIDGQWTAATGALNFFPNFSDLIAFPGHATGF